MVATMGPNDNDLDKIELVLSRAGCSLIGIEREAIGTPEEKRTLCFAPSDGSGAVYFVFGPQGHRLRRVDLD